MFFGEKGQSRGDAEQQKAVHKYVKTNYDRLELTVPKGRKQEIKDFAAAHGETVNGFINRLIDEAMEQDNTREIKE